MKYAVIKIGGKQIQIQEGDTFEIERQSTLIFDVLLFSENDKVEIGAPFLKDVDIKAKIVEEKRGDKIRIGRFKAKSRYRKIKGHRQPLSVIAIESIGKKGAKVEQKVEKTVAEAKEQEKPVKKTVAKKVAVEQSTSSVKKRVVKK